MKKNLAKRIVLGLLTGAVLMSNSVAWAGNGYNIDGDNLGNSLFAPDSINIKGSVYKAENGEGGSRSIAIGVGSNVGDVNNQYVNDSVAIGYEAEVIKAGSVALGSNAQTAATNSMALGYYSKASGLNSVALGYGSVVSEGKSNVVSVGYGGDSGGTTNIGDGYIPISVPNTRHIINITDVAVDNLDDTDYGSYAVNVNTLNAALSGYYTKTEVEGLLQSGGVGGNSGNYVEKETIEGGTQTNISENFVVTNTTVSGGSGTTTSVTINSSDPNNPIVMDNEGITVGTNSTRMDGTGFYVWADNDNSNTNSSHVITDAIAYMNDEGEIKGAGGAFMVDTSGNVTATNLYTKTETDNLLGAKANIADVYTKTETDTKLGEKADQTALVAEKTAREQGDQNLQSQIDKIGSGAIAGINQRLEKTNAKINKVGAGAAALAALHPLDYDPDDKLTFSAGMGNYAGENAAALGAFYRPNEKFMLSLGGTMGNGENMVNLGLSIGLDKASGFAKMSKRELIQEVNAVKAENEAMKDQLANADERIAKLEALVAQLVAK